MMTSSERICKRPATKAKISALTDRRVLEALEREEALGVKHPEHIRKIKGKLKGVKA